MIRELMSATLVMITIACTSDRVIPADKVDSAFFLLVDRFKNSDSEEFRRGLEEFALREFEDDFNVMHERFKAEFELEMTPYINALNDDTLYEEMTTVEYRVTKEEESYKISEGFKIVFINHQAISIALQHYQVDFKEEDKKTTIMNIYKMVHLFIINFSKSILENKEYTKLQKEFTYDEIFAKMRYVLKSQYFVLYAHMTIAKNIKDSSLDDGKGVLDRKHMVSVFQSWDFIQIVKFICKDFLRSVYSEKINFEFESYDRLADSSETNNKKLYVENFTKNLEEIKSNQIFNDNTKIYLQSYNIKDINGEMAYFKDRIEKCEGEKNVIFFEINCFDYFYAAINDCIKYIADLPANKKHMAAQILQKKINILCNSLILQKLELFINIPEETKKKNHYNIYFLYDNKIDCSKIGRQMSEKNKFHPLMMQEIEVISRMCTIFHQICMKVLWNKMYKFAKDVFTYVDTIQYNYSEEPNNNLLNIKFDISTNIAIVKSTLKKSIEELQKAIEKSTQTKSPSMPNRAYSKNCNTVNTHEVRSHYTAHTNRSPNTFATPFNTANKQKQTCFGQHARYYPTPFSQQNAAFCHDVRSMNPYTPNTYCLCTQREMHNSMGCAGQSQIQQPLYNPMQPQVNQHWHHQLLHPTYQGCTHCIAYHPNQQRCGQFLPQQFASGSPSCVLMSNIVPINHQTRVHTTDPYPPAFGYGQSFQQQFASSSSSCVPMPNTAPITHQNATWQASKPSGPLDYGQGCVGSQDNRSLPQQEFVINVPDQTQAFIQWTVDGQDTDDYSAHDLYLSDAQKRKKNQQDQ